MARGTRTVYHSKWNKRLSSIFQPPEEVWSVQQLKRCDKQGDKDEVNSPKNVNNVSKKIVKINVHWKLDFFIQIYK